MSNKDGKPTLPKVDIKNLNKDQEQEELKGYDAFFIKEQEDDIFDVMKGKKPSEKDKPVLTSLHLDKDLAVFIDKMHKKMPSGKRHGFKSRLINECIRFALIEKGVLVPKEEKAQKVVEKKENDNATKEEKAEQ